MVSDGRQEVKDRTARLFVQREAGISDQFRVLLYHACIVRRVKKLAGSKSHSSSPYTIFPLPPKEGIMIFTHTVDRQHYPL